MSELTTKEKENKEQYFKEFFPPILIYVLMIIGINIVLDRMEDSIWVYPIALSPMVPVYFVFRAIIGFVRRSDEFMRRIYGESAVITLIIVNFLGFAYGLLIYVGVPGFDLFTAASMICPLYFVTVFYVKRQYGGSGC